MSGIMNLRYALVNAWFWSAYGSLWAYIALLLEHYGFSSAQVGLITSCATLVSVALAPAVSSFLDARQRLENRHGAMALLALASALSLWVWLVPPQRPLILGIFFVCIGALLASAPPFQNAMAVDANRRGVPVIYGFCRGIGSISYAAASLLFGFLLERRAPTILLPSFALVLALDVVAMLRFRLPAGASAPEEEAAAPGRSIARLLREDPRFTLTLLGCMLFFSAHIIGNIYCNAIVAKVGGTSRTIGCGLALAAVLELPAMTLVSHLRGRFGCGFFLRVSAVASIAKFSLFFLARSTAVFYLGETMQFFQFAFFTPATVYYVADMLPPADQLKGQSLIYVSGCGLGAALGSAVGGQLVAACGVQSALLFAVACSLGALAVFSVSTARGRGD